MCYGSKPVRDSQGDIDWVPNAEFNRLLREGRIKPHEDGYVYARDTMGALVWRDNGIAAVPMRWDLVPRDFLKREDLPLAEVIKRKNSRAKDKATGRQVGFSSYNARVETVARLFSFRRPWEEGLRMATPVSAFKERPNMDEAPAEFRGKEYEVSLKGEFYMAGLYDTWENRAGEKLESCSIITTDSMGNAKLRGIWHERCPVILDRAQVEAWLDPLTTPQKAIQMCMVFPAESMDVGETRRQG